MKNLIVLTSIAMALFSSCGKQVADTHSSVPIDIAAADTYNLELHSEVAAIIALEDAEGAFLGDVHRMFVDEEYILVFTQNRILLFSRDGDFLRKIGHKGNSNNEYLDLNDVDYDEKEQKIYAFDRVKNRMFVYTIEGDLERTIDSKYAFNSFAKCDRGFWGYTCFNFNGANPERCNLMLLDPTLQEVVEAHFPSAHFFEATMYPTFTRDSEGELYFYYPYSSSVYQLGEKPIEIFKPDFGARNLPFDRVMAAADHKEVNEIFCEEPYIGRPYGLAVYEGSLLVGYKESPIGVSVSNYNVTYSLETQEASVYSSYMDPEGACGVPCFSPKGVTSNREIYFTFSPDMVMRHDAFAYYSEKCNRDITSGANNLVVLFRAKE